MWWKEEKVKAKRKAKTKKREREKERKKERERERERERRRQCSRKWNLYNVVSAVGARWTSTCGYACCTSDGSRRWRLRGCNFSFDFLRRVYLSLIVSCLFCLVLSFSSCSLVAILRLRRFVHECILAMNILGLHKSKTRLGRPLKVQISKPCKVPA